MIESQILTGPFTITCQSLFLLFAKRAREHSRTGYKYACVVR